MDKVMNSMKRYSAVYKILVIGDSGVGKTALLMRLCEERYESITKYTIGVDYMTKVVIVDNKSIKLQIWDTAGQERFKTLTNVYFRGAAGAIVVYDVTNRESFENVQSWMKNISSQGPQIKVVLIAHKNDLDYERRVTSEEGVELARHYQCPFFEASSKTGINCTEAFTVLVKNIIASAQFDGNESPDMVLGSSVGSMGNTKKRTCCS
eukprot:Em0010g838a